MKEQYGRIFSEIAPKQSDEELYRAVLGKAESKMKKRSFNKKAIIIPVAAALALTMGAVGVASFGGIEYLSGKIFGHNESVVSEIKSSYYEDSDEHIKMTVEEYLTDGQNAYLTVHYTALDSEGKQWLDGKEFTHETMRVKPETIVTMSYGCFEVEEYRTEADRYFFVHFEASTKESEQAEFTYPMLGSEAKTTMFSLEDNVERKMFRLVGEDSPTEYYMPKYFSLSKLSWTIYGENNGVYVRNGGSEYATISEEESDTLTDLPMSVVMADGSETALEWHTALCSSYPTENNGNTDLIIASGSNVKAQGKAQGGFDYIFEYIDPAEVVGLEIGDCYYELIEE